MTSSIPWSASFEFIGCDDRDECRAIFSSEFFSGAADAWRPSGYLPERPLIRTHRMSGGFARLRFDSSAFRRDFRPTVRPTLPRRAIAYDQRS
ncbi:hypothetical protein [Caballeronia calidae]|uniref:hypothetical protein n=1 Tax=Caballeronia calidae TaxID=1777139 RepID=UPI0012FE31DD|nr:hypothetical protein [Caballeronia calidae]